MSELITEQMQECKCGTCQSCIDKEPAKATPTYKITSRVQDRLLAKFLEPTLQRAVMDAIDHCLIFETCPDETIDYYMVYHETCMKVVHEACSVRKIEKIRKVNTDPKSVAEFKEALLKRRELAESKGKKTPKAAKERKVVVQAVSSNDPAEKAIIKSLKKLNETGLLSMALPMIIAGNPNIDVAGLAKRMGF